MNRSDDKGIASAPYLTAGIDVQDGCLKVEILAYSAGRAIFSLIYWRLSGLNGRLLAVDSSAFDSLEMVVFSRACRLVRVASQFFFDATFALGQKKLMAQERRLRLFDARHTATQGADDLAE